MGIKYIYAAKHSAQLIFVGYIYVRTHVYIHIFFVISKLAMTTYLPLALTTALVN